MDGSEIGRPWAVLWCGNCRPWLACLGHFGVGVETLDETVGRNRCSADSTRLNDRRGPDVLPSGSGLEGGRGRRELGQVVARFCELRCFPALVDCASDTRPKVGGSRCSGRQTLGQTLCGVFRRPLSTSTTAFPMLFYIRSPGSSIARGREEHHDGRGVMQR